MATEESWQRLARAAVERRAQLGITQLDVAQRGPMSLDRVQAIEGAKRSSYRPATLAALERALGWTYGSVAAILDGGEPTPADTPALAPNAADDDLDAQLAEARALLRQAQEMLDRVSDRRQAGGGRG